MRHIIAVQTILILSLAGFAAADGPATKPAAPDTPATRAYAQFKSLAGAWEGSSTKGWVEVLKIRPIAGGSCMLEESEFAHGADPQNSMVTMYHLDGEHLMLTHYCMAQNQPRMRATTISPDAKQITFEFFDGTNMASRDVGHMDKVVFNFASPDQFSSHWTFYAKGKEQWMEQINYRRMALPPATQPRLGTSE